MGMHKSQCYLFAVSIVYENNKIFNTFADSQVLTEE